MLNHFQIYTSALAGEPGKILTYGLFHSDSYSRAGLLATAVTILSPPLPYWESWSPCMAIPSYRSRPMASPAIQSILALSVTLTFQSLAALLTTSIRR